MASREEVLRQLQVRKAQLAAQGAPAPVAPPPQATAPGQAGSFPSIFEPGALELQMSAAQAAAVRFAAEVGGSFAFPGARLPGIVGQGIYAGAVEASDPESTPGSIAAQTALGAAGTAGGDLLGRALKGTGTRMAERITGAMDEFTPVVSQRLRTVADTFGGLGGFDRRQQTKLTRAWARAIGEEADQLTDVVRDRAANRIGQVMDEALPAGPVDVRQATEFLNNVDGALWPGKERTLRKLALAADDPQMYQSVMREMRDVGRKLAPVSDLQADEVFSALDSLATAGEAAGASNTRVVREQYKNLMIMESLNPVWNTGYVPPVSANRAMRTGKSGFGAGTVRGGGDNLLPETQAAMDMTKDATAEMAARFKSSGTKERDVLAEGAESTLGLLTGTASPSTIISKLGGILAIGPALGSAAIAQPAGIAGRGGAALGREAARALRGDTDPTLTE